MLSERHKAILKIIEDKGRASIEELAKTLYVSEMTVRRDLKALEKSGYLQRYHGGAIRIPENSLAPISERKLLSSEEKSALAKRTEELIFDGMSIFIDCSSTCMYIIPIIAGHKNVRIITNSVQNLLLAAHYHIPCIIIGGSYYERDMCTVGALSDEMLQNMNVDIAFCTALGISDDGLITDDSEALASCRKIMLRNAKKTVFLFVGDKKGKKFTHTICRAEDADIIIM